MVLSEPGVPRISLQPVFVSPDHGQAASSPPGLNGVDRVRKRCLQIEGKTCAADFDASAPKLPRLHQRSEAACVVSTVIIIAFSFSKIPVKRDDWLPQKYHHLCLNHFKESDILQSIQSIEFLSIDEAIKDINRYSI